MTGEADVILPSATALVERAERTLRIVRPAPAALKTPASLADIHARLLNFERGYRSLVPPGFESAGRAASVKQALKRFIRPFVWWYVEPRWEVQRDLTADLASFASSSLHALTEMSTELSALRLKVNELEQWIVDHPS